jgi:phage terminase large subunit GpA-like protein
LTAIATTPEALDHLTDRLDVVTKKLLTPPPRLKLSEWCDANRYLSKEGSANPGRWNTNTVPYVREILDVAGDYRTQKIVVMAAAQVAKTEVLLNVLAYYMVNDPSPCLVVLPELTAAKAWSTDRLDTMIRDTPILKGVVKEKRSRDSGNTLLQKRFIGGHVTLIGSNSPSGLRSRPIRVLLLDEVDAYERSAGKSGDPVDLAMARTRTFWNRKIILTSTPEIKGDSRIEKAFQESDQRFYHIPCPHCHQYDKLTWERIKYENNDPSTAHCVCLKCGCLIDEVEKRQMVLKGKWIAEAPGNDTAGFHINALYSPFVTWSELVTQWLTIGKNVERLKAFANTVLGESWEDTGERVETHHLVQRVEKYDAEVPTGVGVLIAGIDVQEDRIEIGVWGYGEQYEMWWIATQAVFINPGEVAWQHVASHLRRKYKTPSGVEIPIRAVALDIGHKAESVGQFIHAARVKYPDTVFIPVKGSSKGHRAPLFEWGEVAKVSKVKPLLVGTHEVKDKLFGRLLQIEPGHHYIHFPDNIDVHYLQQITSERKKYKNRVPIYEATGRNEQLDMMVYSYAAINSLGPPVYNSLATWARQNAGVIEGQPTPVVEESKQELDEQPIRDQMIQQQRLRRMPARRGSWNTGWKV